MPTHFGPTIAVPMYLRELLPFGSSSVADAGATLRLRSSGAAPSLARNRARWVCATHDLAEHIVRDVAFVAGELVAISVRQVHGPLDLEVVVREDAVMVRVHDLGAGRSARSRPDGVGTTRSMQLIRCVAQSWGVSEDADRREMWAAIARRPRSE